MTVANIQQRRTSAGNGHGGKLSPQAAIRKISMHPNKSSRGHRVVLAQLQKEQKENGSKGLPEQQIVAGPDGSRRHGALDSPDASKVRQDIGSTPAERDSIDFGQRGLATGSNIFMFENEDEGDAFQVDLYSHQKKGSTNVGNSQYSFSGLRLQQSPLLSVRTSSVEEGASQDVPDTPVIGLSPRFNEQAQGSRRRSFEDQAIAVQFVSTVGAPRDVLGPETVASDLPVYLVPWAHEEERLSAESSRKRSVRGLRNLGNTCYINSVLQMLHSLESFKLELDTACSKLSDPSTEKSVLFTLHTVLKQLECNSSLAPVNPIRLKKVFASYQERFLHYTQEDAHEFLVYLLDQVQEELRRTVVCAIQTEGTTTSNENEQTCPIKENFGCTVKTTLLCTNCSRTSHVEEPFLHFTLGMPEIARCEWDLFSSNEVPTEKQDLRSLLDMTFKETTVEYKCEKCQGTTFKSCAKFSSLPRFLILHLKRLHVGWKSSAPIKFTEVLDMSKWCCTRSELQAEERLNTDFGEECAPAAGPCSFTNYRLHAMISHLGGSGDCGHFITDAFDRKTMSWLRCDDDLVTPVSPERIFNASKEMEGYIFVYFRDPL